MVNDNAQFFIKELAFAKALPADIGGAWQVIADAKAFMASRGSSQWTDDYPAPAHIEADIAAGRAYVARIAGGGVAAYACIARGEEPAYGAISGRWLTAGPYVTVHRLAVGARWRGCGLARAIMAAAEGEGRACGAVSVRVDTAHGNAEMLGLLASMGYARCGTVSYGPRGLRLAFEKPL